jgi:hypothetical protein
MKQPPRRQPASEHADGKGTRARLNADTAIQFRKAKG